MLFTCIVCLPCVQKPWDWCWASITVLDVSSAALGDLKGSRYSIPLAAVMGGEEMGRGAAIVNLGWCNKADKSETKCFYWKGGGGQ